MDYQGNPNNPKRGKVELSPKPEKNIQSVVTNKVVIQKKSLGRKFRDLLIEADFKSVSRYVFFEVMLPAAKNTIVDMSTKGIERMMYGDAAIRRRNYNLGSSRTTYTNYSAPSSRLYREPTVSRYAQTMPGPQVPRAARPARDDFVISTREEAELVLEKMNDILEQYDVVCVGDLFELLDQPTTPIDYKWGWLYLGDVHIRQIREGFLLDLPPADPIQ